MSFFDYYDSIGNYMGVPPRYFDRMGNEIMASNYRFSNRIQPINPRPLTSVECLGINNPSTSDFEMERLMKTIKIPEIIKIEPQINLKIKPLSDITIPPFDPFDILKSKKYPEY